MFAASSVEQLWIDAYSKGGVFDHRRNFGIKGADF
jgi:hypothetical protein